MTVQIAVKLDDGLAEEVRAAAADAGTNLSEWVRATLQHQALVARSKRACDEDWYRILSAGLGHARLDTVRTYTHPTAADRAKTLNLLPEDR
jgi:hypothetical protein